MRIRRYLGSFKHKPMITSALEPLLCANLVADPNPNRQDLANLDSINWMVDRYGTRTSKAHREANRTRVKAAVRARKMEEERGMILDVRLFGYAELRMAFRIISCVVC